jgi:hypothetical protein
LNIERYAPNQQDLQRICPLIIRIFPLTAGSLVGLPLVRSILSHFAFDQTIVEVFLMPSIDLQVKIFILKSNFDIVHMQVLKSKIVTGNIYGVFNE